MDLGGRRALVMTLEMPVLKVFNAVMQGVRARLGIYVEDSDASVGVHARAAAKPLVDGMHARVLPLRGGLA